MLFGGMSYSFVAVFFSLAGMVRAGEEIRSSGSRSSTRLISKGARWRTSCEESTVSQQRHATLCGAVPSVPREYSSSLTCAEDKDSMNQRICFTLHCRPNLITDRKFFA